MSAATHRRQNVTPRPGVPIALILPIEAARERGVRWTRVLDARRRIAAKWYDRDEVREALVDAVFDELARR